MTRKEPRKNKSIEDYLAEDDWVGARKLIKKRLQEDPEHHWLWTRLSTTYCEQNRYEKALEASEKAITLAPRCPLVLWDRACCLDKVGEYEEAIKMWKTLFRRGVNAIAHGECGEGLRWARSLLNDARYRIGYAYNTMADYSPAIRYWRLHLRKRAPGIPSIYDRKMVEAELAELLENRDFYEAIKAGEA